MNNTHYKSSHNRISVTSTNDSTSKLLISYFLLLRWKMGINSADLPLQAISICNCYFLICRDTCIIAQCFTCH